MKINNGFNILPWYDSLEKQNCKKWYAYGQAWPLLCPQGFILPFQFISDTAITISSNIYAISVETGQTIDLGVKPTVTEIRRADITYYIVKLVSTSIVNLPIGRYNLRMNTSEGFLYSEELVVINNANECIKVEYWNEDTLKFTSGEINFTDDFHFIFYINSTIGKPEYEFEEELTKRLGYKFIESQTSNKVYKFSFVAPEYICDAMRLIRMCDYIKLTTKFDSYNALSFAYEPKWQEQGDLAAVDVEFDTDCIIQKLESFNRRAKESFYNALLADIDEPVLFSTDTVAQYYTEYTASGTISGKLIRQLTAISEDELVSSLSSIVLPVDNQSDNSQVAKKAFLSDIVNKLIPKVNLSDYLLKSIWDKVFEIRTDKQGKEYIFGKLPVVTQYGITMYADGGDIDLPSLYTGLPIDGKTLIRDEKGVLMVNPDIELGGGVSNFWDLSGIPSWITNSKPKYSYSEIQGTPDLSVYAQVDALKAYVTLAGAQTLTGEKNFTGGLKVNGSPIIYDSAKGYWKLQGNLVLTGGITMYADDGTLNLPSIYDGLPIDGTTIYWDTDAAGNRVIKAVVGGGTADSVAWVNITGKPTWIGSSKPVYSYSEIQGTPDLSVYALKTQIPSLSGYATESWVTKQNYATKATTLSGYGITDAYTKTNVDDLLKSYVTLGGTQTITGEKNFVGGLKVNGSPIYYDTEKKYWKLEGDLLVTGGVTMYGSDSSFTPSTIMDAIAVDGTTISKSGGVLKVIGGTGGGVADSVAWANITGKPTWITNSKPSYSYSEITGAISTTELQNYLTQNSYLNVTSGDNRYLKLSGGVLTSNGVPLYINRTEDNSYALIGYRIKSNEIGYLGFSTDGNLVVSPNRASGNKNYYGVWHSGNFTPSDYLPLSGGEIITGDINLKASLYGESYISWKSPDNNEGGYFYGTSFNASKNYVWTKSMLKWNVDTGIMTFEYTPLVGNSTIWHSGNDGHNSGLDADTLDGYHVTHFMSYVKGSGYVQANLLNSELWNVAGGDGYIEYYDNGTWLNSRWGKVLAHYGFDGDLRGNASSATKLQTARTIWGRSFDGTSDISGSLYITNNNAIYIKDTSDNWLNQIEVSSGNAFNIGYSSGGRGYSTLLYGGDITLKVGTSRVTSLYIDSNRNGEYNGMFTFKRASQVPLYISNTDSSLTDVCARFVVNNAYKASIGTNSGDYLLRYNADLSKSYVIWDSGNDGHNSGLDADTLDGYHSSAFMNFTATGGYVGASMGNETLSKQAFGNGYIEFWDGAGGWFNFRCGYVKSSSSMYIASSLFLGDEGEGIYIHATGINFHNSSNAWIASCVSFDRNGNMNALHNLLVSGGITMYSDQRKKTILNHVELSLKQIANAPLIEHYYNSDDKKTTHVGSIAQYWASMNDWFCKLDSEGYYTMEIQNAALASAISIARELDRYENKTDKAIKKLKKRIYELEEEVERLKAS